MKYPTLEEAVLRTADPDLRKNAALELKALYAALNMLHARGETIRTQASEEERLQQFKRDASTVIDSLHQAGTASAQRLTAMF